MMKLRTALFAAVAALIGASVITWAQPGPGSSPWQVIHGGTGRATLTNHGVLVGAATAAITQITVPASGTVFQGNAGADPTWTAAPVLGVNGGAIGTLSLKGNTSGTVLLTPQAAAGTPTVTFGTSSGTPAVTASSPLAITSATGNITCTTCATTTNGGGLTATAPMAISAAGDISVTGSAGAVLGGSPASFSSTPGLGVAGSVQGTLSFRNLTSGTLTINAPSTGALGSSVLTLPIATDTLVGKATTDVFTNKTFDTAGTGNSFSINGVAATANTGTGAVARASGPTFTTPTLGAATATSINGLTITSSTGTLTITNGKTASFGNSITFNGTDSTTMTLPSVSATIPRVVASGAKALATGAISSATCTTAQTDTATGTATTDAIIASFNADPTATTGYVAGAMLSIVAYPTADTVNFKVCNNTASSITPGAVTINWRVVR